MARLRSVCFSVLSAIAGIIFLFSAYTKAFPIANFEYHLADTLHFSWPVSTAVARLLIGIEIAFGTLILLQLYGWSNWILKASLSLITLFSVYIVYIWAAFGSRADCGCFGTQYQMSAPLSLAKNLVLAIVILLLIRYRRGLRGKWTRWVMATVIAASMLASWFVFADNRQYNIDLSALYAPPGKTEALAVNLARGKHIIAFLSQACEHCRNAARRMHQMKQRDPSLPFFMVIAGKSDLTDFFKQTGAGDIPYSRLDANTFLKYTGGSYPYFIWIDNGRVVASSSYLSADQ